MDGKRNSCQIFMNNTIGYSLLLVFLAFLAKAYRQEVILSHPASFLMVAALAAAIAVVAVTVSIFWLWKEERVVKLEKWLGPIGHIFHCGYCFCLWLSAIFTSFLGISFFKPLLTASIIDFFISFLALGFLAVLFFEIITVLWFKKVMLEFELKDLYGKKVPQ